MKRDPIDVFPRFLATQTILASPFQGTAKSDAYNLLGARFASLAHSEDLLALKPYLVEIDISEEIALLKPEYALEITIPVVGTTDLLGLEQKVRNQQQFACPVAINGFGAKSEMTILNNFPHSDFVLITDISGNQYEVIVNQDGKIELPNDGIGLFSTIFAVTFIYSERQVKQGDGLESLQSIGVKTNKLLVLPPVDCQEAFTAQICVTHINERRQRIVDTIRKAEIQYPKMTSKVQAEVSVNHFQADDTRMLAVNLKLSYLPSFASYPITVKVTLTSKVDENFSLYMDSHGWMQHPIHSNVYTKHIGLNENTLRNLISQMYSEYDFIKDYLAGESFGLSHHNGYNNFLLMPEAMGRFYDFLIQDIVKGKLPIDFILAKIPNERLFEIALSRIPVNFHDSILLTQLQSILAEGSLDSVREWFQSYVFFAQDETLSDNFYLYASKAEGTLPFASVEISEQQTFLEEKLSELDVEGVKGQATFSDNAWQQASSETLSLLEHLAPEANLAKTGIYNDVDVSQVLESQAAWTPLMRVSQEMEVDTPVEMTVTDEKGEHFVTKTQVEAQPSTEVKIDPSHINSKR